MEIKQGNMEKHANLVEVLTEFYTLLVQLDIIPASLLHIPDPIDGLAGFNSKAALEAGFSTEAVYLMSRLPFLKVGHCHSSIEIMPSTYPLDFSDPNADSVCFEGFREMEDDQGDDPDYSLPSKCIRLTTHNIYGISFIYDTETCLMRDWKPMETPGDLLGFEHITPRLPTEVLAPWIKKYRTLEILGYEGRTHFYCDDEIPSSWKGPDERNLGYLQAIHDQKMARLKLRDIYLECGWDINSKTQERFDKSRFIELKDKFWWEVLRGMESRTSWASKKKHENGAYSLEQLLADTDEELMPWTVQLNQ